MRVQSCWKGVQSGKSMGGQHATWRDDERVLVRLVSIGLSNKEIATRAGVTETAIKKRLCILMRRYGASNRAALVRSAFTSGAIKDGDGK